MDESKIEPFPEPKDLMGRPFKAGQKIVYAIRLRSRQWLNVGTINVVGPTKLHVHREHPTPKTVTLRALSQVLILEDAK